MEQRRSKKTLFATVIILLVAGWLYFAPPMFMQMGEVVTCRPLSPGLPGGTVVNGLPSYPPTLQALDDVFDGRDFESTEADRLRGELGMSEACGDARINQQTTLIVVLTVGLALMLVKVIRRQNEILARVRGRDDAAVEGSRTEDDPAASDSEATR